MPLNPADDAFAESLRRALPDDRLRRAEPRYLEEPRGRWAGGSGWVALPRSADEVSTLIRAAEDRDGLLRIDPEHDSSDERD